MEDEFDTAVDVGDEPRPPRAPDDRVLPARIGRYHVIASIGRGGMAEVFKAELQGPLGFRRQVAIKRLHPSLADDPDLVSRFVHEATIASRLIHPAICQVYELDQDDTGCFIVMEYLDGITLGAALRELARARWLLPMPIVLRVMRALCAGVHAAHELCDGDGRPLGLVHRDVTPSNVMLTAAGQVRLLDFGVAKSDHTRTRIGTVRGKPGYLSPEQIARRPLDRRSDVFSLGVVLYEVLTSARLFARASLAETTRAIAEGPVVDPRTYRADLPPLVMGVLERALAASQDDRFPSAAALASALLAATSPGPVAPAPWLARVVAVLRDRRGVATAAGTGNAAAIAPSVVTPTPVGTPS